MNKSKKIAQSEWYFDEIADTYDVQENLLKTQLSYAHIISHIQSKQPSALLDVGCGTGKLLLILSELMPDMHLYGLDISKNMLSQAEKKLSGRANLILGDSANIPLDSNSCDVICCNHSFHHYPEPSKVLEEFKRVLKKDGLLLIGENYLPTAKRMVSNLKIALFDKCGDVRIYSERELTQLLSRYFNRVRYERIGEDLCFISAHN